MEEYEEELKRLLKKITPNVETYFGEFSSLNDIKIELNQETTADLEGTDLIKAVWKILGDTINNLKETLTK